MNQAKKVTHLLLLMLFSVLVWSCSKDETEPDLGKPTVTFAGETGEYKVKKGESVTLTATVENAVDPMYSWKVNGKILSTDLTCEFAGDNVGEYFVTFRVDAENGTAEQQVKVTVLDKLPPEINMSASIFVYEGRDTEIKAEVLYTDDATAYLWRLNGEIVSETDTYIYKKTTIGTAATLSLKVSTEDGQDMKVFTVVTLAMADPELFFDNGRYRVPSNVAELRKMTVPLGKSLVLAPVISGIENPSSFAWTVDGAAQGSTTEFFTFTPAAKGAYLITVTEQSTGAKAEVQVTCTDPEGTHFRAIKEGNQAWAATAFDYMPAPGQFVDYQTGSTKEQALQDIQNKVNAGGSLWHIGAWGGYWIVGFDHSVKNETGKADLRIVGNAFAGWSEPGIVWVMQDENGNGQPDDTWYELKGSETGKESTKQRYAITYFRPDASRANIMWTDNMGRVNTVDYNGYHEQNHYFPMFMTEEYYTLTGTCVGGGIATQGGIETSGDLPWGYVDNANTDASRPGDQFWIEDAIQADGSPANLQYIDFVKVHTGKVGKGASVGEISTEPGCPYDLGLI